jgi:hypothetical protein
VDTVSDLQDRWNLVEKVNDMKIYLMNTVRCVRLIEGVNSSVESRHTLHKRQTSASLKRRTEA